MSKVINPLTNRKIKVNGALHKRLCKDVKVNIAGCPERKAPRGGAKKSMKAPQKISKKEQEEIDDLNEFFGSMFGSDRRYQKSKKQMERQRAKIKKQEEMERQRAKRRRAKAEPQEEKKHEEVKVKPKEKKTIKIRIKKTPVPKKKAPEIKHEKKGDKLKFITVEYNQCYNVDVVGRGGRSKTSQSKTFKVNFYKGISTSGKDNLRAGGRNYTLYKGYPSLSQTFDELETLNVNAKYIIILGHGGNTSHTSASGSCNETRQGKGKMPLTTKIYLISGRKLAVDFKEKQDPWMPFRLVNIQKFVDNDWKLTKWQEDNLRLNFPITNRRRKKIK